VNLTHLECPRCGTTYDAGRLQNLCRCGSPLLARYDLAAAGRATDPGRIAARPPDLWRYRELLPVADSACVTTFGEGFTPLFPAPRYGDHIGVPRLLVKDEGLLPTGSFKTRGAAVGVSRAKELGATHVAMPTNGNAGAAWATYAARAGLRATIAMPASAPAITRRECRAAGADLHVVDGLIGDAGRFLASRDTGAFDVSTLKEPYRLEGKKTMGYEIAEQLGWRRSRVDRHPQGPRRASYPRLDRRALAAIGGGAVHRLRADRTRLRGRRPPGRAMDRCGAVGRVRDHGPGTDR
jgi:threonine synthase